MCRRPWIDAGRTGVHVLGSICARRSSRRAEEGLLVRMLEEALWGTSKASTGSRVGTSSFLTRDTNSRSSKKHAAAPFWRGYCWPCTLVSCCFNWALCCLGQWSVRLDVHLIKALRYSLISVGTGWPGPPNSAYKQLVNHWWGKRGAYRWLKIVPSQ